MKLIASTLTNKLYADDSAKMDFTLTSAPSTIMIAVDGDAAELNKLSGIYAAFSIINGDHELPISGVGTLSGEDHGDLVFLVNHKLPVGESLRVRVKGSFKDNTKSANIKSYLVGIGE